MTRKQPKCDGFALVAGLLMIAMVVAASVALINLVAADVNRTREEISGAQMRQVLLAGAMFARDRSEDSSSSSPPVDVALPAELSADAHVSVSIVSKDDLRSATVRATYLDRRVEQTFRFRRVNDRWKAIDVTSD